jgi:hypothetical protein
MWERSTLAALTGGPSEPSIYDPRLTDDDIREMEMGSIQEDVGVGLPQHASNYRRFYRRFERDIGASEGKKTDCIMIQYDQGGSVHGYPVKAILGLREP